MKQLETAIERIKSMEERFDMLLDAAKTDLNLINTDPVLAGKLTFQEVGFPDEIGYKFTGRMIINFLRCTDLCHNTLFHNDDLV